MMAGITIIFPAFVSEYIGSELDVISAYENDFESRLIRASELTGTDLTGFDPGSRNFLEDELASQVISYIYSCTIADILKRQGIRPDFVTGYSMGIYAALYYCGALTYEDGLRLVMRAWEAISEACPVNDHGMGMIIGIPGAELREWCEELQDAWICNRNNPHTFIISGTADSVSLLLNIAKAEGALRANLLPVSKPYHTGLLNKARATLQAYIKQVRLAEPEYPYVSCIDQKVITTSAGLMEEVARNINTGMDWLGTMEHLIGQGTGVFFECGAGDGLTRNFRFVEGDFERFSVNKLDRFLDRK
jgi:malonyl CoA-acyl carrier protein transacylase